LWAELHGRMRAFIGRRISDQHAADDLAQEVLLRLHRHLPQLSAEDRLDAMAYAIARNAIVDHYRRAARTREDLVVDSDGFGPDATAEGDDEPDTARAALARCLAPLVDRLPDRYREAIRLTDLGGLTQVEAAERLELSVPGMKSRVQRGRAQLGDLLGACCEVGLDAAGKVGEMRRVGPCACRRT
jgi:RNA polymerase sigma-70 factor, ECF subfamily